MQNDPNTGRRRLLGALGGLSVAAPLARGRAVDGRAYTATATGATPEATAADEAFWAEIGAHYARTDGVVNLEHGYWGRLADPVQRRYLDATRYVNTQGAWYARKGYWTDHRAAVRRVAACLGAHEDEIALTRNATEAVHNLVRQYRHLGPGDAVLYADADYPPFKRLMADLETWRGVETVAITLPPRATPAQLLERYATAFDAHPNLRLALVTHASNQHGLVLPARAIADAARARGIDVICDAAQSWGLVDLRVADLGADWAAFNLHKWIGAPLGLGALYMRRGSLAAVAPYPGERDPDDTRVHARIHSGTFNFAAVLAIPAALDFHENVGGARKEARLRYLRRLWTDAADAMPHVEVLGGGDEASWSGIGAFRLRGQSDSADVHALQQRLEEEFGVFTVVREGLASGACIRVTPQVFTTPAQIERLADALARLRAR